MLLHFAELSSGYIEVCQRLAPILDATYTDNPIGGPRVTFDFASLQKKLEGFAKESDEGTLT
jgi:hypothetical protein